MTDKEKIREEVERLRNLHQIMYQELDCESPKLMSVCAKKNLCQDILMFIDSLQEEPVSIWHDVNQQPEINTPILVRTYDNIVESTKRYDDNLIPWEDRIKRDEITHWCYVEDLLKL